MLLSSELALLLMLVLLSVLVLMFLLVLLMLLLLFDAVNVAVDFNGGFVVDVVNNVLVLLLLLSGFNNIIKI